MQESHALKRSELTNHDFARFWSKVDIPDGRAYGPKGKCWVWRGHKMPRGYGVVTAGKRRRRLLAHRVAYAYFHGEAPAGEIVRHSCDNRACCQPGHLLAGTEAQNVRERMERSRRGSSPLDATKVRRIRREYANGKHQAVIARRHGVTQSTISNIVLRRSWSDIE